MSLNLSSVFYEADTILNSILSKYVGLKFIGLDQDDENKPYYMNAEAITKGFYYKTKKLPVTGQVIELLKIVPIDEDTNDIIKEAVMLELTDEDDNFLRFSFQTEKEPKPPNFEWLLSIKPNKQERTVIT